MKFSFKNFIVEELTDAQKKTVAGWVEDSKKPTNQESWDIANAKMRGEPIPKFDKSVPAAEKLSSHVIPHGQHKVVIPVEHAALDAAALTAPHDVRAHLEKHGYEVHDYHAGQVKDKYGRIMKLGKALSATKAPDHIVRQFTNDPDRTNKNSDTHQIVISRHPHDVAGMSTDRGWTSCMHMQDGSNREYLKHDIAHGTHVAYLTRKGDDDIKNPIARIALKPFISHNEEDEHHSILRPEIATYGEGTDAFEHTVNKWSREKFPMSDKHAAYRMPDGLYHDGLPHRLDNHERYINHPDLFHHHHEDAQYDILSRTNDTHVVSTLIQKRVEKQGMPFHHEYRALVAARGTDEHREELKDDKNPSVSRAVFNFGHDAHKEHIARNSEHWADISHIAANHHHNPSSVNMILAHRVHQDDDLTNGKGFSGYLHPNADSTVRSLTHAKETHELLSTSKHDHVRALVAEHTSDPHILTKLANDPRTAVYKQALQNESTPEHVKIHHLTRPDGNNNTKTYAVLGLKHADLSEHVESLHPILKELVASENTHPKTIDKLIDTKGELETHSTLLTNFVGRKKASLAFINHTHPVVQQIARAVYKSHVAPHHKAYGMPSYDDAVANTPARS